MAKGRMTTRDGQSATLREQAVHDLEESLAGLLLTPDSPGYDEARAVWNGMIDKRPALIARCSGPADVMAAVNWARDSGILVAVRGGGHNVAGSAVCDSGLVIDLSEMRGVWVDPARRRARVSGGCKWADVDRETQVFGLAAPGGVVSDTGVAGLTLGGGLGWLRNKHGLSCDNLVAADIVTADGAFHQVSAEEEPELFWAIRGGGGNFGVVTSFEFQLHPVGPTVAMALTFYPMEDAVKLLQAYRELVPQFPEEASTLATLWSIGEAPEYPEHLHGRPIVAFVGCCTGPVEEAQKTLEPLQQLGEPLLDLSGPIPYVDAQQLFDEDYPSGQLYYWKSTYLESLPDDVIDVLVDYAGRRPSAMSNIDLWPIGGAVNRVDPKAMAFSRRNAPWAVNAEANWVDPQQSDANVAWGRGLWNALQPLAGYGVYQNFGGFAEEADEVARAAYGDNYSRLAEIKARYDPDNVFRLNLNVQPASQGDRDAGRATKRRVA